MNIAHEKIPVWCNLVAIEWDDYMAAITPNHAEMSPREVKARLEAAFDEAVRTGTAIYRYLPSELRCICCGAPAHQVQHD
jgi:hypothetical protein